MGNFSNLEWNVDYLSEIFFFYICGLIYGAVCTSSLNVSMIGD